MVLLQPNSFLDNPFLTRAEVENGLVGLLDPLAAHASPGGALITFGETSAHYDARAVEFEAFARPLWGLTALLLGGGSYPGAERWVRGLASGTDPAGKEYWGASRAKDQRMVEMSPLSFAIALKPDVFFDQQTPETKANIEAFLNSCQSQPMPDTNWLWFRVFANLALRTVGSQYFNPQQMERDLDRLDSFQLSPHAPMGSDSGSGGWSRDGPEGVMQLDYYSSSFAIQFAQMVYAKLSPEDPRSVRYRERAAQFVLDFVHYFAPTGEGIPFGRSMIYRFAIISTFSAMALCDVPPPAPLEWGHIKGLVLRHLRTWAATPAIFRSDGTLNIGYAYDQFHMTENYNAPGSPYWACKAFACLGALPDHPFWAADELLYPDFFPRIKALPDPMHITVRSAGHTFLLSSGQMPHYGMRNGPAKYAKFAYSAAFGFSCSTGDMDLEHAAADSMLAVRDVKSECDGELWRVRRRPLNAALVGRGTGRVHLRSGWRPFPDVDIETLLIPPHPSSPAYYLRIHKIAAGRRLATAEAGWATYGQGRDGRALVQAFSGETSEGGEEGEGAARATTRAGSVGVRDIRLPRKTPKDGTQRHGRLVQSDPGSNVIFPRSVLPTLMGEIAPGTTWYATAVFGMPFTGEKDQEVRDNEEYERLPVVPDWVFEEFWDGATVGW